MLHESINVSFIAVSVEQLIYLLITRCCLLPILPITLQRRGQKLKSCMPSEVLGNLLAPVVEENLGKNDLPMWGHVMQGRVSHVAEILLSLTSV